MAAKRQSNYCEAEIAFLCVLLVTCAAFLLNFPSISKHEGDLLRTSLHERRFCGQVQSFGARKGRWWIRQNKESMACYLRHCWYAE